MDLRYISMVCLVPRRKLEFLIEIKTGDPDSIGIGANEYIGEKKVLVRAPSILRDILFLRREYTVNHIFSQGKSGNALSRTVPLSEWAELPTGCIVKLNVLRIPYATIPLKEASVHCQMSAFRTNSVLSQMI